MLIGLVFFGPAQFIAKFFHIREVRMKVCLNDDQGILIREGAVLQILQHLSLQPALP